jgi:hypothetical protein
VLLFDNGNRRCTAVGPAADWTCNNNGIRSRLQLYRLEFDASGVPTQAVRVSHRATLSPLAAAAIERRASKASTQALLPDLGLGAQ